MRGQLSAPAEELRTISVSPRSGLPPLLQRRAQMQTVTEGLIIRSRNIGENNTAVTVLTRDYGLISAFANGSKRVKSRAAGAAVSPLTYSQLTLYRGRDSYIIDDAKALEVFFGLRENIEKLSLAQYFCELAGEFAPENTEADELLSLLLNLLYMLSEDKRTPSFLKPVAELRMLSCAGYMPDISGCLKCGEENPDNPVFSLPHAGFFCQKCSPGGGIAATPGVLNAMRHICTADDRALFSFKMPESSLKILSDISERFLLSQVDRRFKTLEFYKSVKES